MNLVVKCESVQCLYHNLVHINTTKSNPPPSPNQNMYSCTHSNMKYWIQNVRQGVQGSSLSVEYSFSAENHQFDTLYTIAITLIL